MSKQLTACMSIRKKPYKIVCTNCGQTDYRAKKPANKNGTFCCLKCWREYFGKIQKPLVERFWSKVHKTDTCWLWTGYKLPLGYGHIKIGPNQGIIRVSRLSWEIHHGSIPEGMFVCHKCDNPACVNPDHLFLGTQFENMQDMCAKNRHFTPFNNYKGEHNPAHKLTIEQVRYIRHQQDYPGLAKKLSEELHVSFSVIRNVQRGIRWKEVV